MKRPLLIFALSFALGVFISLYALPDLWRPWISFGVAVLGAAAAWFLKSRRAPVLVVSFGLVFGILWLWGYTYAALEPAQKLAGSEITATLELIEYPERRDYGACCRVRIKGMSGTMMYYGDASLLELAPGDQLQGKVSCRSALTINGQNSSYYVSRGIRLRLYPEGEMTTLRGDGSKLRYLPQRLRRVLSETVETIFSEETDDLILALLTGERDTMDEQTVTDLEESGLIHLTAVSGLHCGFLVSVLGFCVGGNRFLRAFVTYPVLLVYMFMAGCTPSVIRACVMVGFVLTAEILERDNDPPTSLGAASLVILMSNPYAVSSVSFQLSFAAVAGLLIVSPRIFSAMNRPRRWKRRLLRWGWTAFSASVSASIGALVFTAPVSAFTFGSISIISPLSNLLVLPVIQILFAFALLLSTICTFLPGAAVLAFIPEFLAGYTLQVAGIAAKIPGHAVAFSGYGTVMWLVLVYAMFAVCWFSPEGRSKYVLAAVLSGVTLWTVRMLPMRLVADDALTVVAVDVGQGAATLMHADGQTALVDCGSYYSPQGCGAAVSDAMELYGWTSLDWVILTHYHEDHAGGIDELLARVSVEAFLLPRANEEDRALHDEVVALAQRYGASVQYVNRETVTCLGDVRITVYPQLTFGEVNEEGLTVLCTAGEFDLLITGDMGMSTERLLVETYELPDIEVLMVGHHGSKYSTSDELLKETMPEVGVISVGENSYGHPAREAMKRLVFRGCELYRTDRQGNIVIQVHE